MSKVEYHRINGKIYVDHDHHEETVAELIGTLETCWHVANCYDGNHAKACDLMMETVKGRIETHLKEKGARNERG